MIDRRKHIDKKGSQMVEAAIVLPIIILIAILLIRVFTFYLEILNTGIKDHEKALYEWSQYEGAFLEKYEMQSRIELMRGGILQSTPVKRIDTEVLLLNEDKLVRAGEIIEK